MTKGSTPNNNGIVDYDNEPPLLEELGIKPEDITKKFMAILTQRGFKEVSTYEDMAGAIFVLFLFGFCLLLVSVLSQVCSQQLYFNAHFIILFVISVGNTSSEIFMRQARQAV